MNDLHSAGLIAGQRHDVAADADTFVAFEAATGQPLPGRFAEASSPQVDTAAVAAKDAFDELHGISPEQRAKLLRAVATGMRDQRNAILERCGQETGYLPARVAGEFERAVMQLDMFAQLAITRPWDQRQVDPADPSRPNLPRPELRRRLIPLGPVAVFGACNFALAISVVGNDFVAAIATGCPVIVKSHPGHPGTCELLGRIVLEQVKQLGFPAGTFSLLHGRKPETSVSLVTHPAIAAVGFTGSPVGGRALAKAVLDRDHPIPIFAELGSTNPVFLAEHAMASRMTEIAEGFVNSLRFGNGHMCTKPGVLVMFKKQADGFMNQVSGQFSQCEPLPLLNESVANAFDDGVRTLRETSVVTDLRDPLATNGQGPWHRGVHWFGVKASDAIPNDLLHQETFGPVSLLVTCEHEEEMLQVAREFKGSLTTTLHVGREDDAFQTRWLPIAERFGGRIIFNGWPTGMEIGAATHHGGPYPASLDGRSTSVGHASLQRFVRPVCYQGWPADTFEKHWS